MDTQTASKTRTVRPHVPLVPKMKLANADCVPHALVFHTLFLGGGWRGSSKVLARTLSLKGSATEPKGF